MASLMEELVSVLKDETAVYKTLTEVSSEKTQYIINGDISRMQDATAKEQELVNLVNKLERKREEVVKDIGIVLGRDMDGLTINSIVQMLGRQPDEQKKLSEVHFHLKETLEAMNKVNEQNKVLLKQAMEMVEFDIQLLQSLKKAPETANYNKNAYNTGELLPNSGFDAKQ